MKQILIVAQREFMVRAKSKSTIFSLLIMMVLILGGGFAVKHFDLFAPEVHEIGLTPQTQSYSAVFNPELSGLFAAQSGNETSFKIHDYPDDTALEKAVKDGDIELGLGGTLDKPVMISDGPVSPTLSLAVQSGLSSFKTAQYLSGLGTNLEEFTKATDPSGIQVKDVSEEGGLLGKMDFNLGFYIGNMVILVVLFMFIITAGNLVSVGVVEEKTSRVVEVLISTVNARRLLTGKILGIGAVGMVQMLLVGAAALATMIWSGMADTLQVDLGAYSGWVVVWFLVGLLTYLVLYAGAGAMVARQEEIAQTVAPLTMMAVGGLYAAMFLVYAPNGLALRVISMIPFLNCFAMPTRQLVSTEMLWWEPWLSLGINLAVLPALVWVGARLYRRGILSTSGKIKLLDALTSGQK